MAGKKSIPRTLVVQKRIAAAAVIGFLLGMIWLVAVRFISYQPDSVHYHANFALYINGERDEFESFTFYEEVEACVDDGTDNPKSRVHMHDRINHVVHVHSPAVTWGHFFANLGYALGDNLVSTDEGVFVDKQNGRRLTVLLNGQETSDIANRVIGNEDVLLINYGTEPEDALKERYDGITKDASEYNNRTDPSSCAGEHEVTFTEHLKKAIGIGD